MSTDSLYSLPDDLPRPRVVVRFELTDARAPDRYWVLAQPSGCEVRELVVTPATEPSWP